MPRKAKKASGAGLPGSMSQNRTDRALPIQTPTGMQYGAAGALQDAQRQIPLQAPAALPTPSPAGPAMPAGGAAPGPGGPVPPAGGLAAVLQAAAASTPANPSPGLGAPSGRPGEPVTTGLASGPGPGPEALSAPINRTPPTASVLATMARSTGSALLSQLAQTANAQGI